MTDAEDKLLELHMLIRKIVNERISSLDLREDAEQEAMLAAWERLSDGKSHGIAIHAAKQAAVDVGRGRRMTGSKAHAKPITLTTPLTQEGDTGDEYVVEPADRSAEDAFDAVAESDLLEGLLATLPAPQAIAVRRRLDGLTTREIGAELGVSGQAISLRLNRAYAALRETMEHWA